MRPLRQRIVTGYRDHGLKYLLKEGMRRVEWRTSYVPFYNHFAYNYSLKRLRRRMGQEETLDDVLDTVGAETPPHYHGLPPYRTIQIQQGREEIQGLAQAGASANPDVTVEIGTAQGGSFYVWCRSLDSDAYISIDAHFYNREPFFAEFAPSSDTRFVEGLSQETATLEEVTNELNGRTIDFIFIDGGHTYEAVQADFKNYEPLMSTDGIMAFHDITGGHPGVTRFWNEVTDSYETETVGVGAGKSGLLYC